MLNISTINQRHLWYLIGIITTDGSLSKDGRHIVLTSKDESLLSDIKMVLDITNKIGKKSSGSNKMKIYSILQFGDVNFYKYLLSIGLSPNKSLTLGPIKVPDEYFIDFLRGIIDGDGNISRWVHHTNKNVQWALRVCSGSPEFIKWLKNNIEVKFKVGGKLYCYKYPYFRNALYTIKFGKLAAQVILRQCYYDNCLVLTRKFNSAITCLRTENGLSKYGNVIAYAGVLER